VSAARQAGSTLAVGLIVLTLVMLLGLAGAGTARIDLLLAQNETFRENAALAAGAGIEMAISEIAGNPNPETVDRVVTGRVPGSQDTYEARVRFIGHERALPQAPAARLAGAHFEIQSTGRSARGAIDTQRAGILWVMDAPGPVSAADCEPVARRHCHARGTLERLYWQRLPAE
jgi:Tfp pilus assembly protein PilX